MDFSEIVLKGFCDANNRKFLDKYFVRECKKAEKEQFFEAEEFFNGCLNVVKIFEGCLQKQVLERKSEILQTLSLAKSNKLGYPECKTPEAIEVKRNETIKYCEQELKNVRPDGIGDLTFTVNLGTLTKGRVYYDMEYCEVLYIKESIIKAIEQCKTNIEQLPPQPIVKKKAELKIDQIALKYAYEGLQITRENGNEIAKEYGHNSGEKLFQRFTYFSSSANRKGKPVLCTPKKLNNKIKLIESVIELLPTDKQERAKDEVLILKKIYESEYQ